PPAHPLPRTRGRPDQSAPRREGAAVEGRPRRRLAGPHRPVLIGGPRPPTRPWLLLAVLGVGQLMLVLDATVVNIALPRAQAALGFSDADRQWVVMHTRSHSAACC